MAKTKEGWRGKRRAGVLRNLWMIQGRRLGMTQRA
eukprot:CAMPEP_0201530996 /NCGR_PEP_ID=MMETSP0161_2-20130828/46315_1 /ASSEMBLY_ACC=CAM_ASM_000251 /TAXON_ID=180227 /ORGANISM="Neoparamoeba aestuarina, Strain SoJaBio B1-5/56/2" /LENGTH=34 /DNA_ID= /DNA_START= /DNA_END= /DNA_ORIENTATION=